MKHQLVLLVVLMLSACGGPAEEAEDAAAESKGNVIDETAASMHTAMDKAKNVGAVLEEKKKAADDALLEAEGANPD